MGTYKFELEIEFCNCELIGRCEPLSVVCESPVGAHPHIELKRAAEVALDRAWEYVWKKRSPPQYMLSRAMPWQRLLKRHLTGGGSCR